VPYEYHDTPYYRAIIDLIVSWRDSGAGEFTPAQLAEAMNRNVTPSMRKALQKAEFHGFIKRYTFYTLKGGLAVGYLINPKQTELELKERPF
jgi:hypothetical protein